MALFDFLKRKKEVEKAKPARNGYAKSVAGGKPKIKKVEEALIVKENIDSLNLSNKKNKDSKFSYQVVKRPHISEKASYLSEKQKYTFKVYNNTNKSEIKRTIEGMYGVDVLSVNIIKIQAKKRRIGRTKGFKKGYDKAIVTVKEGQKIEIL